MKTINDVLRCPTCHETTLRHADIVVYTYSEDGHIRLTKFDGETATTLIGPANADDDAYGRRDKIIVAVTFVCESCQHKPTFRIVQHKGDTLASWTPR